MRQIILDTETTGLSPKQGHRIIEIGCVEMQNRRLTGESYHVYINPDREVDAGAVAVHGITDDFLEDKPYFSDCIADLIAFIKDAELVIHNAPFDVGFLEHEFKLAKEKNWYSLSQHCKITDTLAMARKKHPGKKNNLDALCKRYQINNAHREKHGALLDAEILAEVYLAMTGGQSSLNLGDLAKPKQSSNKEVVTSENLSTQQFSQLAVISPNAKELKAHQDFIRKLAKANNAEPLWQKIASE
tara:strand:- start:148310 stop:149041 length:732 start_codon:yes stop_codon:yes gene_type:complete